MRDDLLSEIVYSRERMRIHVAQQKHGLKKQHAGRPHGCCATKMGKKHLANHGLANEKKKCAKEECRSEDLQDCRFASNGGTAAVGAVYDRAVFPKIKGMYRVIDRAYSNCPTV